MKKNNVKILIAYHKPFKLAKNKIFVPIQVGRNIAKKDAMDGKIDKKNRKWLLENTIGDNTGDNISDKNREFCELTATYWAWKNLDKLGNPDYIGLMHYRRYFDFDKVCKDEDIEELINKYDIIMPKAFNCLKHGTKTTYLHYKNDRSYHHIEDYDKVLKILATLYPEYQKTIIQYNNSPYGYFCNMFIMKKKIFDDYCKWLFSILEQAENEIDISNYDIQERRVFGRVAELLTGIYYTHLIDTNKEIKTTETPLKMINDNGYYFNQIKSTIRKLKALYN